MALTLVEASKLSNDVLLTGVIETIIKDSPILQSLPFIEIQGNRASRPHLVSTVVLLALRVAAKDPKSERKPMRVRKKPSRARDRLSGPRDGSWKSYKTNGVVPPAGLEPAAAPMQRNGWL